MHHVVRILTALGRILGTALVIAPLLGLIGILFLDRSEDGTARWSVFPLVLALADPLIWWCWGRSLLGAGAAAIGAYICGMTIGRCLGRRRYWGRSVILAWAFLPAAIPPFLGAIGLSWWMAPGGVFLRLAAGITDRSVSPFWWQWGTWVLLGIAWGTPWVAWRVLRTLHGIDPAWEEPARLAGASPGWIWRKLVRPLVRPHAADTATMVFILLLAEAGATWIFGMRESLAYHMIAPIHSPSAQVGPQLAVLTSFALISAIVVRMVIRKVAGSLEELPIPERPFLRPRARWYQTWIFTPLPLFWGALSMLPLIGLLANAVGCRPEMTWEEVQALDWNHVLIPRWDRVALDIALRTIGLSAVAAGFAYLLAACWTTPRPWIFRAIPIVPPLCWGVGLWLLPEWIQSASQNSDPALPYLITNSPVGGDLSQSSTIGIRIKIRLTQAASLLAPGHPWQLAWLWAWTLWCIPIWRRARQAAQRRIVPMWAETAWTLGIPPRRAKRLSYRDHHIAPATAAALIAVTMALSNAAPSLILAPTAPTRTLGVEMTHRELTLPPANLSITDSNPNIAQTNTSTPVASQPAPAATLAFPLILLNIGILAIAARALQRTDPAIDIK